MALSLSPQQLKQVIHTPSSSNIPLALQSYSTPRQFTEVVHDMPETMSMGQAQPPLLSSDFGQLEAGTHDEDLNEFALPGRVAPDLPSWTLLRTPGDDHGSSASDPEVDELSIKKVTDSATKRLEEPPTNAQPTAKKSMTSQTAGQTLKPSSDAVPSKAKKARFDGVFIAKKSQPHYKKYSSQTQSRPTPPSSARVLSLVDALARTFHANRHAEDPPPSRSSTASHQHDGASTAPQTDVETTEAEDERLQLSTRLAHTLLKRRHTRARTANASETNSEDATSLLQDTPPPERPVKRLKPIQYESNPALIDAALGTVQAPISWDAELDFIVRDEDVFTSAQIVHVPSADVRMAVDEGVHTAGAPGKGSVPPSTPVGNEWRMPVLGNPEMPVLTPYLSRGTKFRQRLDAIFGENATVRTDRVARPKPADLDFFVPLDEPDRETSSNTSESAASVSSASSAEEGASAIPSTHITSQSPDIPPANTSTDQLSSNQLNEVDSLAKPTFDAGEEQINGWITALQRLIKGKVHVKEEDLETLSIILAEIESVKDSLDESVPMISELRESVKQLSKLYEIPYGDRNKLRQRAENIFRTWLSIVEPGAS